MPRFEAIGQHCEFLEKEKMTQLVGYPAIAGMAHEIVCIQPYRLARGLRQRCLDQDVRIYENTPIKTLRSTSQGVQLIAADGATLTAQKVILATNAYTNSLMLDVEIPATSTQHTYMLATEPLEPDMLDRISQARTPFGDPALSFYIGRIYENRLIFNGIDRASQVTPEDDRHLPSFIKLHKEMLRRFPFLDPVSLAGAWGGAVQQTTTDAPIVRRSKSNPNVILNIGYGGGSGVGMALLSGQLTTGLVLERGTIDNDAQRLRTLLVNSRFPRMGPVRAAFGVLRKMVFG
jgi:glycine/D-amino acid oxidase-like deaminating enzyme